MIYWNGCSFVRGMELENRPDDSFAHKVSAKFNQDYRDNSKVGGSNDRIWRTTLDDCLREKPDLAIIVWSNMNRWEFLDDMRAWRSAVWVRFLFDKINLAISEKSETHFHPRMKLKQWEAIQGHSTQTRNMRYNLIYSLHYMLSTKYFLESQKIPYIFYLMSEGQLAPSMKTLDENRWEGANNLWQVPHMKRSDYERELPFILDESFYTMCKKAEVPFGPKDHPLEEGHDLMANRIIKDIYDKELDKIFS